MRAVLLILTMILFNGCAHMVSEESRRIIDPSIEFEQLRKRPDTFAGKYVMLGGIIATVKNGREGGQMEVVQFGLDRSGVPADDYGSGGRFIAVSPLFLDPVVYMRGRLVNVVGEVKGSMTRPLDEVDYTYPVISIREIHVWKGMDQEQIFPYPPSPPYDDPYYFGYWPDSYWYRPLGPKIRP